MKDNGVRNSEKLMFLLGPGRTLLVEVLDSIGIKAEKCGMCRISNSIDSVREVMPARVKMKTNNRGCRYGYIHDYVDGKMAVSLAHLGINYNDIPSKDKDIALFFLCPEDNIMYGVRASKFFEPCSEGSNYWNWLTDTVVTLRDCSGTNSSNTVVDMLKMKTIAEFIIPVDKDRVKKYFDERERYNIKK